MGIFPASIQNLPIQNPSVEDFWYLGLVCLLILIAYLMNKKKGNLALFGSFGLLFFPAFSLAGYLIYLILKNLGIPLAILSISLIFITTPVLFYFGCSAADSSILLFEKNKKKAKPILKILVLITLLSVWYLGFFFLIFKATGYI